MDAGCTSLAKTGTFKALTYGQELPYETKPMITSECVSCLQVDQNANNNNNNNNQNNNNSKFVRPALDPEKVLLVSNSSVIFLESLATQTTTRTKTTRSLSFANNRINKPPNVSKA